MTGNIDREAIVSAARRIVEHDGAEALSMRRLARDMGTKPMTLYYYVPTKDALLRLLLTRAAEEIPWPTLSGTPRDRMVGAMVEIAERLGEIDWIVPVLRRGTDVGAPALTMQNQFLNAAFALGASPQQAVDTWRACWYLVSSELQWQREIRAGKEGKVLWHETMDPTQVEDFPTVRALLPRMSEISRSFDLAASLGHQIDGAIASFSGGADGDGADGAGVDGRAG